MSLAALRIMAGAALAWDPPSPFAGTTPTVYPGAIATGAADPAAEERFNVWMDGFLSMSQSRQLGEMNALAEREKSGALTAEEKRRLTFMRNILGVTKVPEMSAEEMAALAKQGQSQQLAELSVVGKRPGSGLGMFAVLALAGGVAFVAAGKRRGV